jgi:hypothetical protein
MICLVFPDICFSIMALNLVIPGDLLFDLAIMPASKSMYNVSAYCHFHVCIEAWDVLCEHASVNRRSKLAVSGGESAASGLLKRSRCSWVSRHMSGWLLR